MIRKLFRLDVLIVLLLIFSILSMFVGVVELRPRDLFSLTEEQQGILLNSRLPRTVSIIIAGASLAVCGLIMQQLTRNKFVSPTTAGTMDWAQLGILIGLVFFPGVSMLGRLAFASVLAVVGTLLFMQIISRIKFKDIIFVPLIGLMLGGVVASVSTFLAIRTNMLQAISGWMHGSFSTLIAGKYEILYISIPLFIVALLYAHQFTVAGMGEDFSKNLGLNYQKVLYIGLFITAVITALVVVSVGMLPFLGLIVPNIVSVFRGDHLRSTIFLTAVLGAIFVMICDVIGRVVIYPYEISVGLTIAIIGGFVFLFLIFRRAGADA
ncbi:ABC transporter permease [Salinicoccus halodurans]|uniref:Iron ABC transporter permease n=1 Tax=Salinicoccus halodurans TaxID=407035 RepID=A0A0F7HJF2_9STAP|nr:ABC transporter permease [Salinicoccus halodurans]AKG73198.1 iron ABC transporter permease [Salinicoccus halodurans]SFK84092.1 iron complex transport system permease protein [Salinicoccus halodurans]